MKPSLRTSWLLRMVVVLAGAVCMAPGCNGDVISDPTFRLWCGANLCDWTLDAGHVTRVGTWHPDDYGVQFDDAPTQISQETGEGSDCMEFSAVADVDATSQTSVQIDYNLDGVPDTQVAIAQTGFRATKMLLYGPAFASRLRLILRKDGPGHAVLAEIRLQRVSGCTGARVQVSGFGIGDPCDSDGECKAGICCAGVCSACCDKTHPCKTGQTCGAAVGAATAADGGFTPTLLPQLCDPELRHGLAGDPCVVPADCASGQCTGVTQITMSDCPKDNASSCDDNRVRAGQCQ